MSTQPINLTRTNRDRPTMRQPKGSVITAIFGAAAFATGFVAGTAVLDASPIAIRSAASSSMLAARSAIYAVTSSEGNRAAKADRLRVPIAADRIGVAIKLGAKDEDSGSWRSRAPRETARKPVMYCEPVGSQLAGPAVRNLPPRSCLARLGRSYNTLLASVAPQPLDMNSGGAQAPRNVQLRFDIGMKNLG